MVVWITCLKFDHLDHLLTLLLLGSELGGLLFGLLLLVLVGAFLLVCLVGLLVLGLGLLGGRLWLLLGFLL